MATVTVTKDNIDQLIADNPMLVLDFWAAWCGPCKRFGPIFEAASDTHADVVFGKVNTEEEPELAAAFGIQGIPATAFFRDQMPLHMQSGLLPAPALDDSIQQVRDLDMDAIRAEVAKREQEAGQSAEA